MRMSIGVGGVGFKPPRRGDAAPPHERANLLAVTQVLARLRYNDPAILNLESRNRRRDVEGVDARRGSREGLVALDAALTPVGREWRAGAEAGAASLCRGGCRFARSPRR